MPTTKPALAEPAVRKSLVDWGKKQHFRYDKVRFYRHKSKRPVAERKALEKKWIRLAHEADQMIIQRKGEIVWYNNHHQKSTRQISTDYALSFAGRVVERPSGSNSGPFIHDWQRACAGGAGYLDGAPWCGVFCWNMLVHAGVKNVSPRMASVGFVEDDARAKRGCFRGWTTDHKNVLRGDLVILFGYGVHIEMVIDITATGVVTVGGNTSSGVSGSQSNGGGCFKRFRYFSDVHGFALINYP